jgi:hypothetical protein
MLITRLLDCLIQRAAAPPPADEISSDTKIFLGGLGTRSYMESCNALFQGDTLPVTRDKTFRIQKIRSRLEHVFDMENDCTNRLIIPIVQSLHFFVLVVDFKHTCPEFFVNVECYDSMRSSRSTRGTQALTAGPPASEIVAEVNVFLCHFVLHRDAHQHLHRPSIEVFEKVRYHSCPAQRNGIDCGLFCVGIVLHILDRKTVDSNTFTYHNVTELSFKLSTHFTQDDNEPNHQPTTSQVVRDCFPKLQGTSIVSEYGVEDVTPLSIRTDVSTTATTITTRTRSTTRALAVASIVNDYSSNESTIADDQNSRTGKAKTEDSRVSYSSRGSTDDKIFQEILNERKIDMFATLEDIDPLIEEYERKSVVVE